MLLRILAFIILLFSILFLPFWISIILGIFATIYFRNYWEVVVLFFISDFLYGVQNTKYAFLTFTSGIFALLFLILVEFLKKKFKFYPRKTQYRK
ncbi:MAG TPA: hypothetical protein PLO44_02300 [Candidatus Paceibacterota bacterium]|nr:hypothetical protein [Candidatus Paceibacterota bacterium]